MQILLGRLALVFVASGFVTSATAAAASPVEDVEQHFAQSDRDGDGALSSVEVGSYGWKRYDTDGDGSVSRAEFITGRNADRAQAAAAGRTAAAWSLLDWNHDDFLSGTELDGKWDRYDADGNGRVTKPEFFADAAPGDPPPEAQVRLWGATLDVAKQTDLFTFFRLEEQPDAVLLQTGTRYDFLPKAEAFRKLVLVQLLVDDERRIKQVETFVSRNFIDDPRNGVFARDFVKSVLVQATPPDDYPLIADLTNEIQFGGGAAGLYPTNEPPPKLPDPPTPGYEVYLGRRERFEKTLGVVRFSLANVEEDDDKLLIISLSPKDAEQ